MINWPKSLIDELAQRRCILFLGAGVAASARNRAGDSPLDWNTFLVEATKLISKPDDKDAVTQLIHERKFPLALNAIADLVDPGDYQSFLNDCFNDSSFKPSELHSVILDIDARFVITTNFDKIYERHCLTVSNVGFKVIPYYSESLADEIRSDTRLIIKAHGSIDDISKMVFTRKEYHQAKKHYPEFYNLLKALLLTNTCVFIGCGMEDPDVLFLLEELKMTTNSKRPHYALLREGAVSSFITRDLSSTYNVRSLFYGPDHSDLILSLHDLYAEIEGIRITT
ncbi:SIR2 family protein [Acinetobacter baumannii]|uniref:SIR2 family protein n=1 Tax=Acinetobacter baumannii TaxID=470 RepID=UPI0034CEA6E5